MALGAHDRCNAVIDAERIVRVVLPLDRDRPVVAFGVVGGAQFLRDGADHLMPDRKDCYRRQFS